MESKLKWRIALFSSLLFFLTAAPIFGIVSEERKLNISIVGSVTSKNPLYNPFVVCYPAEVRQLLLNMAESPLQKENIQAQLQSSPTKIEDLLRLEIIREEEGLFYLNFPLFTEKDEALIMKVAEKYAKTLAENILSQKDRINELLQKYQPASVSKEKLAFIAVGCLSLDFGALDALAENNYIVHQPEKPGGNRYVLSAAEVTEFSLKEIYWGGHSDSFDGIMFLTFGDHDPGTRRYGFPDILWGLERTLSAGLPEQYKKELAALLDDRVNHLVKQTGEILLLVKKAPLNFEVIQKSSALEEEYLKFILAFLTKIHYVEQKGEAYALAVPVFGAADKAMLEEIQKIVQGEVLAWAGTYYEKIKDELKDISAVRHGVDYRETFNMLWHYFFGYTNKHLARSGFIYDTYQSPEGQKGYLPAVMVTK